MRHFPFSLCAALISAVALAFPTLSTAAGANLNGSWIRHESFDHQLVSLAPTPERLYILMHPMEYRAGASDDIGSPVPRPFFIDAGSASLRPLSDEVALSGEGVRIMRYNPLAQYLLIGYEEGEIDLIFSDGSKREVSALSMISFPGLRGLHEVTFSPDGKRAYVASDFGYVLVGADNASDRVVRLGGGLKCIAEAGADLLGLLPDGSPVIARGGATSISDFVPLRLDGASDRRLVNTDGTMRAPLNILPLADDAFASLFYLEGESPVLAVMVRRGGVWHAVTVVQDGFRLTPSSLALNSMADNNGTPNRDGYYFHAGNIAYQLLRDVNFSLPDTQLAKEVVQVRYKTADGHRESASWDFSNYWFYLEREGFYSRKVESGYEGATAWLDRGEMAVPDFSIAFISDEIVCHPSRGLLLQNHGVSLRFSSVAGNVPPMLCALKNGKWSNFSPSWHIPDFAADDASLLSLYNSLRLMYPVTYAKGVEIDPDNPDFIYSGSMQGGICRFDLAHPSAPVLHLSHPADKCADFPGFVEFVKTQKAWSSSCNFTTPRFDSEGNLWTLYYDLDAQRDGQEAASVFVWPRADRLASADANTDVSSFRDWVSLNYPGVKMTNYAFMLPLKAACNPSLLVVCGNSYAAPLYVINHGGTLADTSDDKIAVIRDLVDAEGAWVTKDRIYAVREDPASGMVWVGTDAGVFYFSPSSAFYDAGRVMRPLAFDPDRGVSSILLDGVQVYDIAFDAEGRKWIATHGAGVVCLSADNSRIEGKWTSRDSSLPSDVVYSVGCDIYNGNVLASTEKGLAEYVASGVGRRLPGTPVSVSPSRVGPDFNGWINVRGLPVADAFAIVDSEGMMVRRLSSPGDGSLRWDALDADGRRCPTGRFFVSPIDDLSNHLAEIIVLGS